MESERLWIIVGEHEEQLQELLTKLNEVEEKQNKLQGMVGNKTEMEESLTNEIA